MKSIRNGLASTLLVGGALLAATAGISSTFAQSDTGAAPPPGMGHRGEGHGPMGPEHLYHQLGLSADQHASIKAIMVAAKPQMKTLHEQMHANRLKMMQTKPDDPNYGNVVAEVSQTDAKLAAQRTTQEAELRAQMYAVLNPAQKTQLAALEAQWEAQPHHGWGPPPAPPQ